MIKKTMIMVLMGLFVAVLPAMAGTVELEINYMESFDPNKELSYTNEVPEIKAVYRLDNDIRLWVGYRRDHMDLVGAYSYNLDIFSGGIGYEHNWNDIFSSYIDGGVAIIQHESKNGDAHEGQSYYQSSLLPWTKYRLWDDYSFNPEPALLLTFGSKIEPWQNIGFNIGVQALLYEFNIQGKPANWEAGQGYWTFDQDGVQVSTFVGLYCRF